MPELTVPVFVRCSEVLHGCELNSANKNTRGFKARVLYVSDYLFGALKTNILYIALIAFSKSSFLTPMMMLYSLEP